MIALTLTHKQYGNFLFLMKTPLMGKGQMFAIPLIILLLACPVWAGTITLEARTTIDVSPGIVRLVMTVANRGDATAHRLTPMLRCGDWRESLSELPTLAPGGEVSWTGDFDPEEMGLGPVGSWPLFLRLRYHDDNLYPFTLTNALAVKVGDPGQPPFSLTLDDGGEAEYTARIRNDGTTPLACSLEILAPFELVAPRPQYGFALPPGLEEARTFTLENRGALPGGRYTLFFSAFCATDRTEEVSRTSGKAQERPTDRTEEVVSRTPEMAQEQQTDSHGHTLILSRQLTTLAAPRLAAARNRGVLVAVAVILCLFVIAFVLEIRQARSRNAA